MNSSKLKKSVSDSIKHRLGFLEISHADLSKISKIAPEKLTQIIEEKRLPTILEAIEISDALLIYTSHLVGEMPLTVIKTEFKDMRDAQDRLARLKEEFKPVVQRAASSIAPGIRFQTAKEFGVRHVKTNKVETNINAGIIEKLERYVPEEYIEEFIFAFRKPMKRRALLEIMGYFEPRKRLPKRIK